MKGLSLDQICAGLPGAPADVPEAMAGYWRIGADAFAPVLASFARWAVGTCIANGTRRIFGIMREGRFLGRLIEATARDLGGAITVEEIWLSRRAVIGAALYPDDLTILNDLVVVAPGNTVDEVFAALGLDRSDVAAVLPDFDMRRTGALAVLSQTIATTPALRDKALTHAARRRGNLLEGLARHIDLTQAKSITLLDLGHGAIIQKLLGRILAREGVRVRLEGLYFALNDRALRGQPNVEQSSLERPSLDHPSLHEVSAFITDAAVTRLLNRAPEVLEGACLSREGSLSHYDDDGAPVLLANQRASLQLDQMEALQAGIMAGASAINRNLGNLSATPHDSVEAKTLAMRLLRRLMLSPTPEEAVAIGEWQHEDNFDLTDRRRLADLAFDPALIEYRGLAALGEVDRQNSFWPAAAFARVNPFLAEAFAAASEGSFGPRLLTSGPLLGALTIIPDFGLGFDPKRARTAALALNAFGRGELQLVVKDFGAERMTRVKFIWPAAQAVMAIGPPVFLCRGEREIQPLALRGLQWSGTRDVHHGLQLTSGEAVETVIELADPPAFPHTLEMTLRFKYLRLSPIFAQR